jgi:GTP pyrophosphokinase
LDPEDDDSSADDPDGDASLAVERRITVSALLTGRATGFDRPTRRGLVHRRSGPADIRPGDDEDPAPPVVPSRRARRIAALLGQRPAWERVPAAAPLLEVFRRQHPDADAEMELLRRSYQVAEFLHGEQQRRSGAPYVSHPLAVAAVLAELGMDVSTLVAALLHDTVEDTDYTLAECRVDFGAEVARLVDGVTKLDGARLGKDVAERETFRKMVLAAGVDLRVLLIKLVDRLHNLRTLAAQPPHKQVRIARQSMDLLVPFCDRLGLYRLKREMEDISFQYLNPNAHAATAAAVAVGRKERDEFFAAVRKRLRATLRSYQVRATVTARPRHLYSIYEENEDRPVALSPGRVCRVVIVIDGDEQDCYLALGAVHAAYPPLAGRTRDYIAAPKFNLYQSLHTSVIGPYHERIDVLVRTTSMQDIAEDGIAAAIRDISRAGDHVQAGEQARHRRDLAWLQGLLVWQGEEPSEEYLDELRTELRGGSIVVVSPNGELVSLPAGATGIDYAFARGGRVGDRLISMRVNGMLRPVTSELNNGDLVEALTTERATPDPEWLNAARTARARRGLRAIFDLESDLRAGDISEAGDA